VAAEVGGVEGGEFFGSEAIQRKHLSKVKEELLF
jgi:hypothetical protein